MTRQRGFTLIEMMVVVAIVGILAAFLFGLASRPVSANAQNVSEQIVTTMGFARLRAASTRKTHMVRVEPTQVSVWEATETGLRADSVLTYAANSMVQQLSLPRGVVVYGANQSTAPGTATEDTALVYDIMFRPDGQTYSKAGGVVVQGGSTLYVTDGSEPRKMRVLIYHATGGAHARSGW